MYVPERFDGFGDIWSQLIGDPVKNVVKETERVVHKVGVVVGKDPLVHAIASTAVGKEIARAGQRVTTVMIQPASAFLQKGDVLGALAMLEPTTQAAKMAGAHHSVIDALRVLNFHTALRIQDPRLREKAMAGWTIAALVAATIVVGYAAVAGGVKAGAGYLATGTAVVSTGSKLMAAVSPKKPTAPVVQPNEMYGPPAPLPEAGFSMASILGSPYAIPVALVGASVIGLIALKYFKQEKV